MILLKQRDDLTPDFSYYLCTMDPEEVKCFVVMGYWLVWKCGLHPDYTLLQSTHSKNMEARVKATVLGFLETIFALSVCRQTFEDGWPHAYCLSCFVIVALRSLFIGNPDI